MTFILRSEYKKASCRDFSFILIGFLQWASMGKLYVDEHIPISGFKDLYFYELQHFAITLF